jgi:hypothetical protein
MPFIVGAMQDRGIALADAMAYCIAVTGALVVFFIWIGPETRGRVLTEDEDTVAEHERRAETADAH